MSLTRHGAGRQGAEDDADPPYRIAGIAIGQFTNAGSNPGRWTAAAAVQDRGR